MLAKFNLNKSASNKFGECPIRVSFSAGGVRKMTTIGYSIHPDFWDEPSMRVKEGTKKNPVVNSKGVPGAVINARIANLSASLAKAAAMPSASLDSLCSAFDESMAVEETPSRAPINAKPVKAERTMTLLEWFDIFVAEEQKRALWTEATRKTFHTCRGHMVSCFGKNIKFADMSATGISKFIDHVRVGVDFEGHPIKRVESTVEKNFKNLKWFLMWAIKRGVCDQKDIMNYRTHFSKTKLKQPVIYLNESELQRLYKYQIPANGTTVTLRDSAGREYEKIVHDASGMATTRDLFCFCAFTSLRYSDMAKLRKTDIHKGVNGTEIRITTQKDNDAITVSLNKASQAILNKYADYIDPKGLGRALPVIVNQAMNRCLKDLCELCGIDEIITKEYYAGGKRVRESFMKWQLVGTHAARRSFICYALTNGWSPQEVMKVTGHHDYDAMKPYIDIASATIKKRMMAFDKFEE